MVLFPTRHRQPYAGCIRRAAGVLPSSQLCTILDRRVNRHQGPNQVVPWQHPGLPELLPGQPVRLQLGQQWDDAVEDAQWGAVCGEQVSKSNFFSRLKMPGAGYLASPIKWCAAVMGQSCGSGLE